MPSGPMKGATEAVPFVEPDDDVTDQIAMSPTDH